MSPRIPSCLFIHPFTISYANYNSKELLKITWALIKFINSKLS
jgi:hypothetical protein